MSRDHWAPGTRAVHAGLPEPTRGEPFLPGPVFAGPFHLPGDPEGAEYDYGRYGNPTWTNYEAALGELEGGEAVVFASGMAAVTAVLYALGEGGPIVVPDDGYFMTRRVAARLGAAAGVEVRRAPTDTTGAVEAAAGARLVIVETPSNPGLDVCDVSAVAEAAQAAGALLAVDNTLATPLRQRPLELGAGLSLGAGTKALAGHADLMIGHVAARDPDHAEALRAWRRQAGAIPGPFEAWLAHRSLATLGVRLERQEANALALAELLAERDDVTALRYPGLPDDPAHAVAARQMQGFGGVLGFDAGGRERAEAFLADCELVIEATSFGGVHTTAERRARWGGDDVGEGWIRLSAGIEDTGDVCADVARALDATA
ncbi:MAG TPA: cystathionine gamma-lyase [Solirubrobacteraceae bacterium]|nr:cystathionine gamma-lyase [Solirubrobacteraceae bacterium]